ncbi:MAG: hypothetical protein ABIP94_11405 [Planctomycetota bacterium]
MHLREGTVNGACGLRQGANAAPRQQRDLAIESFYLAAAFGVRP